MAKQLSSAEPSGMWRRILAWWFAIKRQTVRFMEAADVTLEGPALLAVAHPADWMAALVLVLGIDRPVRCLVPKRLVQGFVRRYLARSLGIILHDEGETYWREATWVLGAGGTLLVFADDMVVTGSAPGATAATAAGLMVSAEAQQPGLRIATYPVHLFLSASGSNSGEALIYVDSALVRPVSAAAAPDPAATKALSLALESRWRENAFQLQPADLEMFLRDLEEALRTGLQEDWASRPEWKQDAGGFVLSRFVSRWASQANYLDPEALVRLRKLLDDYRGLQRRCALRELEVEGADSPMGAGWRRAVISLEMLLGLPIAVYGFLNHLLILAVLWLGGSFKPNRTRSAATEWAFRAVTVLAFYAIQIALMTHWRGRAAAGYYAPSLPVSGAYLWRYVELVRPQARLLFIALTIPRLKRKVQSFRDGLYSELESRLAGGRKTASPPR